MNTFTDLLFQPFRDFWTGFVSLSPNLMAMLVTIIAGLVIAWVLKFGLLRILRLVNFDVWCDKVGMTALIRKGDIWAKPADFFARGLYLFIVIIFFLVGLSALRIAVIDNLVAQFFFYLPRLFAALIILVIGYIIAGFLSRAVLIAAVNRGYHYAKVIAEAVRLLVIIFVLAMAMEQLQVAPGIVTAAFSILFGGIVLALAIAFGVGGVDEAKRIIEKGSAVEKKEGEGRDIEHL